MPRTAKRIRLGRSDHGRIMSLEDFERAIGREGYRYELNDGRVEVFPTPELWHSDLVEWVDRSLRDYMNTVSATINKLFHRPRLYLPERRPSSLEPDLIAFRLKRIDLPLKDRRWSDINPVLVIEVTSEDTAAKDLVRNVGLYLEIPSITEYWVIDPRPNPDEPMLSVYRRRGARWQRPIVVPFGGTYETRLLPGFRLLIDPRQGAAG
jgi:Uma2 family endonuclease